MVLADLAVDIGDFFVVLLWIAVFMVWAFAVFDIFRRDDSRDGRALVVGTSTPNQLEILSDLHDAGKLTDAEFAAQKAKLLA